jgi:hypothetical protein
MLDFAKAMIDEGFHPMTEYFPLLAHGTMLIEPMESESKAWRSAPRRCKRPAGGSTKRWPRKPVLRRTQGAA